MSREVVVRLASFIAVSLAMAAWESAAPRRQRIVSRGIRWPANLGILAFDTVLVMLLLPFKEAGGGYPKEGGK